VQIQSNIKQKCTMQQIAKLFINFNKMNYKQNDESFRKK
jgi:hypothetical protein